MSKGNRRARRKKSKTSGVPKLPVHPTRGSHGDQDRKLSEIIKEMGLKLLRDTDAIPSEPAMGATLILASAAWNRAVGDTALCDQQHDEFEHIDWGNVTPWAELRSHDTNQLIAELVKYKQEHYANDLRRIIATEMTPKGNVRVHWVEPDRVVTAHFGSTTSQTREARAKRGRPIAEKLIRKMKKKVRGKVVNLEEVMVGRANAEALQKTVASQEEVAGLHPAHAAYVYAQNQVSVMSEQITALDDMARFVKIISEAEDQYLPCGPPLSPLTTSFFTCWALFDACVGLHEETVGTTTVAVGAAFGMHEELVRLIELMQQSRMGIYVHEGAEGDAIVLRELVTDVRCRAIVPSGYRGRSGELWYVRVLPPPLPGSEHVVFTTPYLLLRPGTSEWQAYFLRTLPDAPLAERIAKYEHHMKYGPTRDSWTEFVFEAYVNHRADVIFLEGLPDVADSRPHAPRNL